MLSYIICSVYEHVAELADALASGASGSNLVEVQILSCSLMTDLSKNILYEDNDIVALDKPAGLVVHPVPQRAGYGASPDSVSEWFVSKYPESKNVGEPMGDIERPGIVHRIDRETSGVLLLAKTKKGHACLKEQFQKREIEKIYHLFVSGNLKDDRGTIDLPIGRGRGNFRKWEARPARLASESVAGGGEKREAITYFQVLKRAEDGSVTFVEAKPKTGRTHQIRVHFKALHHPLVCDKLYAPNKPCLLDFNRLALHARAITFKTVGGKKVTIEAPYPEDFQKASKNLI
ncbi:MAG: Pseudouridine synthase, RluA family [Parcubacteria group bacterium GW2011_GWD1_44_9]|nr:MAG: Pseudouridine synthase, RluA family [Parcubacteria group bacterium GW2011_GWC1_43_30]KKT85946.1 MAG: Pseudouridine synthase, RluA family [Parcubacteria group bacterium GW2011_GWD1_44_9]